MAQNNTIQYNITAKDQASAVFANVATSAKGFGKSVADAFANTKEATEKMQAAVSKVQTVVSSGFGAMTGDFSKLGSLFGAIPGPIGVVGQAVGDTLGRILDSTIKASEGFRKLSEKTGASVEFLSRFTEAADDVFISSESVSSALNIFAKKIGGIEDAMDGSGVSAGAFAAKLREIGVTSDNMEEALLQVADRFKEMPNGTDKAALAVQLFGKQGAELIPILNKGRDGIKEMGDAADALGLTLDTKTSAAVKRLKERQDAFNDMIKGTETRLGKELIPTFLDWSDAQALANKETGGMLGPLRDLKALYLQLNSANYQAAQAVKTTTNNIKEFGEWGMRAEQPMNELARATVDMGTALQDIDGPTRTVNQLFTETADAIRIATIKEYDNKEAAEQLAAKQQALADATNNVNSAFGGTPKAMDAAEKAIKIYQLSTKATTVEQFTQQQAMEALRKAADTGVISWEVAGKALVDLSTGALKSKDAFLLAGAAGTIYAAETDKVVAAAAKLQPKDVTLTVHNRWDDGEGVWDRYLAAQDKTVTVRFNMVQGTNVEQDDGSNRRAKGGPVKKGKPYIVGEQGQEMFVPYTAGYIVPNNAMPYTDPGTKVAQSFNVNNPSIIIQSTQGAAIAQQIARQNANVARRARARASLMG